MGDFRKNFLSYGGKERKESKCALRILDYLIGRMMVLVIDLNLKNTGGGVDLEM